MSKSRQEKTKTPAQSAPPPPVSNDIVPGRFTEADWHHMIEEEDGEDFVCDIVLEIVESTMQVLHDRYISSQTLPYAVQEARDLLLHMIEWQFLACDGGEENPAVDSTWLEEDEPVAPITDSWAQGSVPVAMQRSSTADSASSTLSEARSESSSSLVDDDRPHAPVPPFRGLEVVSETPLSIASPIQPSKEPTPKTGNKDFRPKPPSQKKQRGMFKSKKGKLPPFSGVDLTSLTDAHVIDSQHYQQTAEKAGLTYDSSGLALLSSSTSILRAQHGRPPGNKDVVYDEWGNVVAVMRINPDKLPSHRVRTKFTIVDPEIEALQLRTKSKSSKAALYTMPKRDVKDIKRGVRPSRGTTGPQTALYGTSTSGGQIYTGGGEITPLPPPLVDSMDVNAGVVVREGGVIRRGPRQVPPRIDNRPSKARLQPLDSTASARSMSGMMSRTSPIIRPLHLADPVPPIMSHSPPQSAQ